MKIRYAVRLTGENAEEAARALVRRLVELGSDVCPPEREPGKDFEGVAVRLDEGTSGPPADGTVEVSPHDTPDFAAEKILDRLEEEGVISLESEGYTPEEEEEIRQRLADLGYID
jgi:hypothetical protein